MTIVVITAGLRQPSTSRLLADRLAAATTEQLPDTELKIVELREYARELTNHLLTGFPSARLAALLDEVAAADALIAVSPIFSGSYSGLFKTFFDVLPPETLAGKPVVIGATGGTARHSLVLEHALRPLFSYLHAVVVPTGIYAAPEDWGTDAQLGARIERAVRELAALLPSATAPAPGTEVTDPASEDEVVDFEKLLGGLGPR
jgi:FMN reductase